MKSNLSGHRTGTTGAAFFEARIHFDSPRDAARFCPVWKYDLLPRRQPFNLRKHSPLAEVVNGFPR